MRLLYFVSIAPGISYDCIAPDSLTLAKGDMVVHQCERYQDCGVIVSARPREVEEDTDLEAARHSARGRRVEGQTPPDILRVANDFDKGRVEQRQQSGKDMEVTASRKISEYGLPMKLLNSHVSFDGKLVVFQFAAESRVDFRKLLRDLSSTFRTRVELRQVGVRDEAAIQGGIGTCGRPFCCATFLKRFSSVNVRMAKTQGLSLNPTNISGACGRLKCCLRYEEAMYRELMRSLPKQGYRCSTPEGPGKVLDVNALTQLVRVALDSDRSKVQEYTAEDIGPPDDTQPADPGREDAPDTRQEQTSRSRTSRTSARRGNSRRDDDKKRPEGGKSDRAAGDKGTKRPEGAGTSRSKRSRGRRPRGGGRKRDPSGNGGSSGGAGGNDGPSGS